MSNSVKRGNETVVRKPRPVSLISSTNLRISPHHLSRVFGSPTWTVAGMDCCATLAASTQDRSGRQVSEHRIKSNDSSHRLHVDENLTREAVVVVEDDASVRTAVKELIESVGLKVRLYASAGDFLETHIPDATSCLVLDVRLPEVSGIKVQEELSRAGAYVPIVFISGYADVAMAVRAMKAGAVDFLTKPFRSQDLLDAVFAALERDTARRKMQELQSILREHYESLSARERQVIARVSVGKLNKQIAADLGLSEVTVKVHRANAMRKMRATSLAHLVKMLEHFNPA
jgi:FixJ family two-component response regulator